MRCTTIKATTSRTGILDGIKEQNEVAPTSVVGCLGSNLAAKGQDNKIGGKNQGESLPCRHVVWSTRIAAGDVEGATRR
jgi:hypothetical protein